MEQRTDERTLNADPATGVPLLVDHLFRHQAGQVVSTLTRLLGPQHLDLAEDVVQETLIKALQHWPFAGVPANPGGWLLQVARNHALDVLRRDRSFRGKQEIIAQILAEDTASGDPAVGAEDLDNVLRDDQLRMMFTCCHPAIAPPARVALTLKTLGGFGVPEIARAFLTQETTVSQRLVRAKRAIKRGEIAFAVPEAVDLPERLDSVLEVLYLIFNEGYSAHQGEDLVRFDLCAEAIRLTSILAEHPAGDAPKVQALLALLLLQASRLPARTDAGGDLLLLDEQDRTLWDRRLIAAGIVALGRSARGNELSTYHLQAGIAACYATATGAAETDWTQVLVHYDDLVALDPSPVAWLNRAVVVAEVRGPAAGMVEVERLREMPGMRRYHLYHATRAELARRMGDRAAIDAYQEALACATNEAERRFLARRLAEVEGDLAGKQSTD